MPTRTELIPCPTCQVPRPLVIRKPYELPKLAARLCRTCAQPPQNNTRTQPVLCHSCGIPRLLVINKPSDLTRAEQATCRPCANRARNQTRPPQDIDEMAVQRLIAGQPVNANPAERSEAVAYLTRKQLSLTVIAERLRCTKRTVERHRAKVAS